MLWGRREVNKVESMELIENEKTSTYSVKCPLFLQTPQKFKDPNSMADITKKLIFPGIEYH